MKDGFLNLPAEVATSDGRNCGFIRPLYFAIKGRLYRIPIGAKTDGCSTPRPFWIFIPPFGKYWPDAAAHDSAYQATLEIQEADGTWRRVRSKEYWDDKLILHLMKSSGVNLVLRYTIYYALRLFGWKAFNEDRAKQHA